MKLLKFRSSFIRPAQATAYAAGDEVSNHATAGSVVRAVFTMEGFSQARILSAGIDILAASGNVVTTAADFELAIFRTDDAPNAVGDNTTHPFAASVRSSAVAIFRFDDTGYTGPLGTVAAGTSQHQAVLAHRVQPLATNVPQAPWPPGHIFNFDGKNTKTLTAVLRALAAWNPGNVANTIGITLEIEAQ